MNQIKKTDNVELTVDRTIVVLSAIVVLVTALALNLLSVTVLRQRHATLLTLLALSEQVADVSVEIEIVRSLVLDRLLDEIVRNVALFLLRVVLPVLLVDGVHRRQQLRIHFLVLQIHRLRKLLLSVLFRQQIVVDVDLILHVHFTWQNHFCDFANGASGSNEHARTGRLHVRLVVSSIQRKTVFVRRFTVDASRRSLHVRFLLGPFLFRIIVVLVVIFIIVVSVSVSRLNLASDVGTLLLIQTINRNDRSLIPFGNENVRSRALLVKEMVGTTPIHQHKHLRLLLVYELAFPLATQLPPKTSLP